METEILQLLDELKGVIDPKLADQVRSRVNHVPRFVQQHMLKRLKLARSEMRLIERYLKDRARVMAEGIQSIKSASKKTEGQYHQMVKDMEQKLSDAERQNAEEMLNDL